MSPPRAAVRVGISTGWPTKASCRSLFGSDRLYGGPRLPSSSGSRPVALDAVRSAKAVRDDRIPDHHERQQSQESAHGRLKVRRAHYIRLGQRALLERLLVGGTATADDVRASVQIPDGMDPVCFGVVPAPLARMGIIRRVDFATTSRAVAHARPVSVWRWPTRRRPARGSQRTPRCRLRPRTVSNCCCRSIRHQ